MEPVITFTMSGPISVLDFLRLPQVQPSKEPNEDEVVDFVYHFLIAIEKRIMIELKSGSLHPEVTDSRQYIHSLSVPDEFGVTEIVRPSERTVSWEAISMDVARSIAHLPEFHELCGLISRLEKDKFHENAGFGVLRFFQEHALYVLDRQRPTSYRYRYDRAKRCVESIARPRGHGVLRVQIAEVLPPQTPIRFKLGFHNIQLRRISSTDFSGTDRWRQWQPGFLIAHALMFVTGPGGSDGCRAAAETALMALRLMGTHYQNALRDEYYTDDYADLMRKSCRWHERAPTRGPGIFELKEDTQSHFVALAKMLGRKGHEHISFQAGYRLEGGQMIRESPKAWLQIPLSSYFDALRTNDLVERKMAHAMMSLESLLLRDSDKGELSFKLSQRTAALAEPLGLDPFLARRIVRIAYDLRSKFVHGSTASPKELLKLDKDFGYLNFPILVLTLTRSLLMACLSLVSSKEELVALLDDSMISGDARKQLEKHLRPARRLLFDVDSLK